MADFAFIDGREHFSHKTRQKPSLSLSNITHCNKSTNLFESLYYYSFKSSLIFLMHVKESEQILIKIVKNHFPLERVIIHNLEKNIKNMATLVRNDVSKHTVM